MIVYKVIHKTSRTSYIVRYEHKLQYLQKTIVKALLNTPGIFCFKRKRDAKKFCKKNNNKLIIKVKGIGKETVPLIINQIYGGDVQNVLTNIVPVGTICYPAVEVLE